MKTTRGLLVVGFVAWSSACEVNGGSGGAGGDPSGTGGSGGEGGSSVECFSPSPLVGAGNFLAMDGANSGLFSFTVPEDPEGGVVTVVVTGFAFFSEIRVAGTDGALETLDAVQVEERGDITASTRFVAAPGVTYEIEIEEGSVSGTNESQSVSVSWSLESIPDCFEPNDTREEAFPLVLGETVEPFLFAGFTSNEWPSYEAHHDWFVVEVESAGELVVNFALPRASTDAESTLASALQVRDANDDVVLDTYSLEEPLEEVVPVEAGKYFIRIEPFISPPFAESVGIGANWSTPYSLAVTAR
jgi:hypothetical protein